MDWWRKKFSVAKINPLQKWNSQKFYESTKKVSLIYVVPRYDSVLRYEKSKTRESHNREPHLNFVQWEASERRSKSHDRKIWLAEEKFICQEETFKRRLEFGLNRRAKVTQSVDWILKWNRVVSQSIYALVLIFEAASSSALKWTTISETQPSSSRTRRDPTEDLQLKPSSR